MLFSYSNLVLAAAAITQTIATPLRHAHFHAKKDTELSVSA